MATVTRYVDTASVGGDGTTQGHSGATAAYLSLSAWEAAEQTNLVTDGDVHVVNCAGGADNTTVTIGGWTTGASNDITIQGDATAPDDDGVNHGDAFSTSFYYLVDEGAQDAVGFVRVTEDYVTLQDLQFSNESTSGTSGILLRINNLTTGDAVINLYRLRSRHTDAGGTGSRFIYSIQASVAYDLNVHACTFDWATNGSDMIVRMSGDGTWSFYNNVFSDANNGLYFDDLNTVVARNNAFINVSDDIREIASPDVSSTYTNNAAGEDLDLFTGGSGNFVWGTSFIAEANAVLDEANGIFVPMPEGSSQGLAGNGSGTIATATVGTGIDGIAFATEDIGAFADTGGVWYVDLASSGGSGRTRDDDSLSTDDGSKAFASLSLAEAAFNTATFVGEVIIKCQGITGGSDATRVAVTGLFTGSGRLIIESDDGVGGHGTYDSDGRNTGTSVFDSSFYSLDVAGGGGSIDIGEQNVTVRYLQFTNANASGGSRTCIDLSAITETSTDIIIEYNRFYHNTAQGGCDAISASDAGSVTGLIFRGNLIVWDNTVTNEVGVLLNGIKASGDQQIHNNTIISAGAGISLLSANCVATVKNNCILNSTGAPTGGNDIINGGASSPTVQFNLADDDLDTEFTESTNIDAEASPYSNTFVSYQSSGTTGDYTPKAGSALEDAGTAITGFTKDMLDNTFGTMDIGCFAVTAAGGGASPRRLTLLGVS